MSVEEAVEFLFRVLAEGLREEVTRVVHEHIEPSEARDRRVDQRLPRSPAPDLACDDRHRLLVAHLLGRERELLFVARIEHDVRAARQIGSSDPESDSAGCARDDDGLIAV